MIRTMTDDTFQFLISVLFQPSYTPAQFENSLGKLQCVTVKAPRQIIDVGVVRVADNNTSVRWELQTTVQTSSREP